MLDFLRRIGLFDDVWRELRAQFDEHILIYGQVVQIVYVSEFDPPDSEPFMYTIGNHAHGLPELLVLCSDQPLVAGILNRLGALQRERGTPFADGEFVSIGGRFPLRIVDAGEIGRTEYATLVRKYYGTADYEVRQVLLCDPQGRWPDTPGCDFPYAKQPILSRHGKLH